MTQLDHSKTELMRAAWTGFWERVRVEGEHVLDVPKLDELERADGVRHVARQGLCGLQWRLEFADPDFPVFFRHWDDRFGYGPGNIDNTYMHAQVHGDSVYRLYGEPGGREFILSAHEGDYSQQLASNWIAERYPDGISMNDDGSFNMIVGGREQSGNWMPLHPGVPCVVGVRQYFLDFTDRAVPGFFSISRIDGPDFPPAETAQSLANRLRDATGWVARATANNGDLGRYHPDVVNEISAPSPTGAVGSPRVAYGIGHFELGPEEVLLVEMQPPRARTWFIATYNIWGDPSDFQNRQSSLNSEQVRIDSDGLIRLVISSTDPQHPNWLDTDNRHRGVIWFRCYMPEDSLAQPRTLVLPLARLWDHLPADTTRLSESARKSDLALRRAHFARRYQR